MTELKKSIIKSSVVLMILFAVLIAAFFVNILNQSDRLINSPYNKRLNELRQTTKIGSIYDTNKVLLAGSSDGKREYHSNETMRKSVAHLIGDTYGYCPAGAEIRFASLLLDYNESLLSVVSRNIKDNEKSGNDINLTIDSRLNIFAYDQIKNFNGAVIIQDYTTGEILCMVSAPSFDPENIIENLTVNLENDVFVNRAIQGQYAPGSLFQIITAGAVLENIDDIQSRIFRCTGSVIIDSEEISCDVYHGFIGLDEAFAQSCSCVFADLGVELGAIKLKKFAEQLKFNYNFNYYDVILYSSNISVSKKEEDAAFAYAAIGQHETVVSPLHMSMIAGAIANNGIMMSPGLLKSIDGKDVYRNNNGVRVLSESTAAILQDYMHKNILYGNGSAAQSNSIDICGKDGTAISSVDNSLYPNSWFLGYINDNEHPIVVSIILEQSYVDENPAVLIGKNLLEYAYSIGY